MTLNNITLVIATSEEVFHWTIHLVQLTVVLVALYRLVQNYRAITSKFNLGLVVFGIAMVIQITLFLVFFTIPADSVFHFGGEIVETLALLVFLYLISQ